MVETKTSSPSIFPFLPGPPEKLEGHILDIELFARVLHFPKLLPLPSMFMNKHIQILVSVVVISMMMLHMAIPHSHHHHEQKDEEVTHNAEHDHDHHDHDHHHTGDHPHKTPPRDTDNAEGESGLFVPIEKHLHAFHIHEFVPATKIRKTASPIKAFPVVATTTNNDIKLSAGNEGTYRCTLFRPIFYDNPFLLNCSLRAPPYSS
ncbi:MAG: hypothetical protein K9I74_03160 [Bacteroidales bacterium]|nr:hypothetical protein [Bacteroidales bacterium]